MKRLNLSRTKAVAGDATSGSLSVSGIAAPSYSQLAPTNTHVTLASDGTFTLDDILDTASRVINVRAAGGGYAIEVPVSITGDGTGNTKMPLGINLTLPRTYGARAFANVLYQTGSWQRYSGSGSWTQDKGTIAASVSTDQFRLYLFDGNGNTGWVNGTYRVFNPDGCKIAIGTFSTPTGYQTWTTSTQFDVNITPTGGNGVYLFAEGSVTNNNGNIAIIQPGHFTSWGTRHLPNGSGDIFNSQFITYLQGISPTVIRFMDWGGVSHSVETDWADRVDTYTVTPTRIHTASSTGGSEPVTGASHPSYEWMIELANRIGAHPWICIPPRATDAHIASMATLIKSLLPAGKKWYCELGNEIWNGKLPWFQPTQWYQYFPHTKRVGVHNGSGAFTLTAHGFSEDQNIRAFWTRNNIAAAVSATGDTSRLYSGYYDLFVHVIDANTFSLKLTSGGTALSLASNLVDAIFFDPDEVGKSTNIDTNYATRLIQAWDIIDPIMGVSNVHHICATQAAFVARTTARMAVSGMSSRADSVAVAPYYNGPAWAGKIATASGSFTPTMWSNTSNTKMYVGVYATGSTPTINDVINGTGAGFVGKCASTSYTTGTSWSNGGGGLTAITVVNGTTYDVHFVWEDTSAAHFRNSTTITATASVTSTFLTDTNINQRMRMTQNYKYVRAATYPLHSAAAPGKPIICYEQGPDFQYGSPAEVPGLFLAGFLESSDAGEAFKVANSMLANAGFGLGMFFSDAEAGKSFALSNDYYDTSDYRYVAFASLNGNAPRSVYLSSVEQTAVGGQSAPGGYPTTLLNFADPNLTYYIYSGNDYGCYDIVGSQLRLINGNGSPWLDTNKRLLKVYATNGKDSMVFDVNANSANWWVPNSVVDVDYDNDRARIAGVSYASVADAVAAGAIVIDGTHEYVTLGSALGSSYTMAFKGTFPSAYLGTAQRMLSLDDGNDGAADETVQMLAASLMRVQAYITHLSSSTYSYSDTTDYSPGSNVRVALRAEANNAIFYYNGTVKGNSTTNGMASGLTTLNLKDRWEKDRAWTGGRSRIVLVDAALTDAQVRDLLA